MILQQDNGVKWTQKRWVSSEEGTHFQKLSDKKWTKNLEEVDTDASASWAETIDQNLSDIECSESRIVNIDIMGKSFTVDCLDMQEVKSFLERLDNWEEMRQKRSQIKMVILDSLCK